MNSKHRNIEDSLGLVSVDHPATHHGVEELLLNTDAGVIQARFHPIENATACVVWVGGAGGGLDGPAGGLYPRIAGYLEQDNIASFRLHYRHPAYLQECVMDTLLCIEYLKMRGLKHFALAGHSFGGAVVITAGAMSKDVTAVVAMSSQTYGTGQVSAVSPRPLLLMHGTEDEILPDTCSHDLYRRAREPKEILLYEGCRHGLDECRDRVDRDLTNWLKQKMQLSVSS